MVLLVEPGKELAHCSGGNDMNKPDGNEIKNESNLHAQNRLEPNQHEIENSEFVSMSHQRLKHVISLFPRSPLCLYVNR